MRRWTIIAVILTLAALGLRLTLALGVAVDCSGDGPVYRQFALNLLDRGIYSADGEAPFVPSLIRMPGYPLTLAGIFSLFGHDNLTAVHWLQAFVDTATCWLAALLCWLWAPVAWEEGRRRGAALWAFALLAACPFTAVYAGTTLTETWTLFFGTLSVVAGSWALRTSGRGLWRWAGAGFAAGATCLYRPDSGLLAAALGFLLVGVGVREAARAGGGSRDLRAAGLPLLWTFLRGLALSAGFVAALAPWAIRNALTFGVFQPLAPAAANAPGEFVAEGYGAWVKTWLTRPRYIEFYIWPLDERPMDPAGLPPEAFDSAAERERVKGLFDAYNGGGSLLLRGAGTEESGPAMTPEVDAGFAALARERAAAHPLRQLLLLPARRAWNLWFDAHSVYYPFDGYLLPLSELPGRGAESILLPSFYLLTWAYTVLAAAGLLVWWREPASRRWIALLSLLFLPRLAFLSTLANPEPRYMVEMFPFVAAAGGVAIGGWSRIHRPVPGDGESARKAGAP